MFCPKCGTETPNDSQFCRKCGKVLGTGPKKVRWLLIAGGALLLMIAFGVGLRNINHAREQANVVAAVNSQIHTVRIANGAIAVPAGRYMYYQLPVPTGAANVRIAGHFAATGGSGNDIEVYLLTQDGFENWKNGHETPTLYSSGKVTAGDMKVVLPNDPAAYYLIFSNIFSPLTPKAVEENLALTYATTPPETPQK